MNSRGHNLVIRAEVIRSIRHFFELNGFLEIETPLRIPANAPEEHIDPAHAGRQYLQTSPEICMKRLLCRGHKKFFQISHCWRSNERGRRHLPEFTILEWYRADSCYNQLMNDCGELLAHIAQDHHCLKGMPYQGQQIRPAAPAERITVREAFRRYSAREMDATLADGSFDECMVTEIEPGLPWDHPVFLTDYPVEHAALARVKQQDSTVAERFELYLGGLELANGFSELNDPVEQRARFMEANRRREARDMPPLPLPEPFLEELGSMPASAGIALGIDRLVMLFCDTTDIDSVVAFTPEEL